MHLFCKLLKRTPKCIGSFFESVWLNHPFAMAHTRFEYVKSFENEDKLEPGQWVLLRLELVGHKQFLKDNSWSMDYANTLSNLLTSTAIKVMKEMKVVALAYGYSNVFNFLLAKDTNLYKRRAFKLHSSLVSLFSSYFVTEWRNYFKENQLKTLPIFEGVMYLFPQDQCLRDFLTKEQNNCHHVNLTETTVLNYAKVANIQYDLAWDKISTVSESEKNEILFSSCNINYNNEPPKYKKGSILLKSEKICSSTEKISGSSQFSKQEDVKIHVIHQDFCKNEFWETSFKLDQQTKLNNKFNHLQLFQRKGHILPHTWLVVRIDGKGFHRFSEMHKFAKPNDDRSINLMNAAASVVVEQFPSMFLAYGQSDEYSFVLKRYGHREKDGNSLISRIVSVFTVNFVHLWSEYFADQILLAQPVFDARLVLYPTNSSLRDYLSWRQADCHINNMYNTCFWNLVKELGYCRKEAESFLRGTYSKDKLTFLEEVCSIRYEDEKPLYRKGTVLYVRFDGQSGERRVYSDNSDLISDTFWSDYPAPYMIENKK